MVDAHSFSSRCWPLVLLLASGCQCGGGSGADAGADAGGDADAGLDAGAPPYEINPVTARVSRPSNADPRNVRIALNSTGTLGMAVWAATRSESGSDDLLLFSYYSASTWSPEALIAQCDSWYAPAVAQSGNDFMVVYERGGHVYARRFGTASGAWDAEVRLDVTNTSAWYGEVSLAASTSGFAAAWGQPDASGRVGATVALYSSGAWGAPASLAPGAVAGFSSSYQLGATATGFAIVWRQGANLYASVYGSGAWGATTDLAASAAAIAPQLAASGSGYAVTWSQGNPASVFATVYAAGVWSAPVELDASSFAATAPQIASNGTGYAVAWAQAMSSASSSTLVHARVYSAGVWGAPTNLDSASAAPASFPQVASDGMGYAVVWRKAEPGGADTRAALFTGAWGASEVLDVGTDSTLEPRIGGRAGVYVAAWPQWNGPQKALFARRHTVSWSAQVNLITRAYAGETDVPRIAVNAAGDRLAVWAQYHNGVPLIYASRFTATAWEASAVIAGADATGTYALSPVVASNGTGFVVVARVFDSCVARVFEGGAWGAPATIELGTAGVFNVNVASNGAGYAAVWTQAGDVFASVYSSGAWGTATVLETASVIGNRPVVTSNGTGYAVAWYQNDGVANSIYANLYAGGAWGTATLVENAAGDARDPRIASNGTGYALTWPQNDGTAVSVFASVHTDSWSAPEALESDPAVASSADVASNGAGYLVTWRQGDVTAAHTFGRVYDGAWGPAVTLDHAGAEATPLAVGSNGSGYAVVWRQKDGAELNLYVSAFNGNWSAPALLESLPTPLDVVRPDLRRCGSGYCAVWEQADPVDGAAGPRRIWATKF